ncbi:MAG: hydroxymethylbilane synthase [Gammaproteobacteria bacterium]
MRIAIATRRSPLAMRQSEWVATALCAAQPGLETELLEMSTRGDELLDRRLAPLGGKGLFIKALEEALESGRARLAVHSLKDVPAQLSQGFVLAAIPVRADPRDVLVSRYGPALEDLPRGARVGTASLRRQAQLLAARPDLRVETVRGSVQTRLSKVDDETLDAVVLAAAGLERLGLARGAPLPVELMLPASGQGALALEIRVDDAELAAVALKIEDAAARAAARAERAFCKRLGASCAAPVAAYATVAAQRVHLRVLVAAADGSKVLAEEGESGVEEAVSLGEYLADEMLARGAAPLIAAPA